MSWAVIFLDEQKIIEIKYEGIVDSVQLKDALEAGKVLAFTKKTVKVLADCTNLQGGANISELSAFIGEIEQVRHLGIKEALLLPQLRETRERVEFYEMACQNRGILVKIFDERNKALDWLVKL